jgi:hypothetical protein
LYARFPTDLDDRWHYTKQHFDSKGLTIENALESLGFPRTWAALNGSEEDLHDNWRVLRNTNAVGPQIQEIFLKYLNQVIAGPDNPKS